MSSNSSFSQAVLDDIKMRRADILSRIDVAARSVNRDPTAITLTAVSKVQPEDRVDAMLATGQRVFGENRVQEAVTRWSHRKDRHSDLQLRLIGPLQSNKSEEAVAFFDVIESVDRLKIARTLAQAMDKLDRRPELLVQVNTGEEPQKTGVSPKEADAFITAIRKDYGLAPVGVMCIPPVDEPPGPHFALLKKIADRNGLGVVSAGMSGDFETAIRIGATHVRVGSAMFGERQTPA